MGNTSFPRASRSWATAQIEPLERRQMLNAAVMRDGRLTVYCTENTDLVEIGDDSTTLGDGLVQVYMVKPTGNPHGTSFTFPRLAIRRIRVFGDGNLIKLDTTSTPNLTDVAIYLGPSSGGSIIDSTVSHRFNRGERVSMIGGTGDDDLNGGGHTVLIDGGAGSDTLSGGEAGATLSGGDGNDLVSAYQLAGQEPLRYLLDIMLLGQGPFPGPGAALGSVILNGGAGDDVIVGNNAKVAGVSDTLSGGGGDDAFFPFSTDQITDFGVGLDTKPGANQFTPPAAVIQTATLKLSGDGNTAFAAQGLGDNGPNNRIAVTDANGTLTMQGPSGSQFLLGDFLNAIGYPVDRLGITPGVSLIVNGFASPLTGDQIAGYQINNGDVITLSIQA